MATGRGAEKKSSSKTMVNDQISQSILSTSNLIHVILQSSPSQDNLLKLSKNLVGKTSTINNTKHVLHQMPFVISSLDAHMDHLLQSAPHLETVTRLLSNLHTTHLDPLTQHSPLHTQPEPESDTSSAPHYTEGEPTPDTGVL